MKKFLKEIKNKYNKINFVKEEFEKEQIFYSKDLYINTHEDGLDFHFMPPGWYFDTTDVGEGVAIIKGSHYKNDSKLRAIVIPDIAKSKLDVEQALYWLTGGNTMWRFGQGFDVNVSWDEIYKEVVKDFGGFVKKSVIGSRTLGDLLDKFKDFSEEEFIEWAFDQGIVRNEEDDEEDENEDELDKNVKKVDPNQGNLDLEEELDEMSTTGSVAGYNVPFAFKKGKKNKVKKIKKVK